MPTFILSNASFNEEAKKLSFLATATQGLYINRGPKETIAEMLDDLGVGQSGFERWTVDHFVTYYLLDDEPPSDNWRDIWLHTWEIQVHLTETIHFEMAVTHLVETLATDGNSWGDSATLFPAKCVLIADFYDSESLATAKKILPMVNLLRDNEAYIEIMRSQAPQLREKQLKKLRKEYQKQEYFYKRIPEDLSIHQRHELPLQLMVTVGTFTQKFFKDDATLAYQISDLIHELGGTTTWHERIAPRDRSPYGELEGFETYYAFALDAGMSEVEDSFLTSTNIAENTWICQIDREITLGNYATEYDFWVNALIFIYQDDRVVDCRLTVKVDWEYYLDILEEGIFNITEDFSTPLFGGEFHESKNIELEVRLCPDLLPHLLRHATTVCEAAAYILKWSQEKPHHPLTAGQNWFCTQVKQPLELESGQEFESMFKGYSTFWHHLSVSELTLGQADCQQFSQRLTEEYKQWIEAGNGRIKDASEEIIDGVSEWFEVISRDIQQAVTQFENLDGEIYQVALKFFAEQFFTKPDFPADQYENIDFFSFDFQGKNGEWSCIANMNEKNQEFFFSSRYPGWIPTDKAERIVKFLVIANHFLSVGNFDMDSCFQMLWYKTGIRLPGIWSQDNPLNQELLKQLVYTNLKAMDRYWSAIKAILEQDVSLEEAFEKIEE